MIMGVDGIAWGISVSRYAGAGTSLISLCRLNRKRKGKMFIPSLCLSDIVYICILGVEWSIE